MREFPELSVREVDKGDFSQVEKVARLWEKRAREYSLSGSETICSGIARSLKHASPNEKLYVCESYGNALQGLMVASQEKCPGRFFKSFFSQVDEGDCFYVSWLASNPENLICKEKETDSSQCIRGVGTSMLSFVEHKARQDLFHGVYLKSLPEAYVFYQKQGFVCSGAYLYKDVREDT